MQRQTEKTETADISGSGPYVLPHGAFVGLAIAGDASATVEASADPSGPWTAITTSGDAGFLYPDTAGAAILYHAQFIRITSTEDITIYQKG